MTEVLTRATWAVHVDRWVALIALPFIALYAALFVAQKWGPAPWWQWAILAVASAVMIYVLVTHRAAKELRFEATELVVFYTSGDPWRIPYNDITQVRGDRYLSVNDVTLGAPWIDAEGNHLWNKHVAQQINEKRGK